MSTLNSTASVVVSDAETTGELLGSFRLPYGKPTSPEDIEEIPVKHAHLNVDKINNINKGNKLDCGQGLEYMTDLKVLTGWLKNHEDKVDQRAYAGTTILARSGLLSELCEFKKHGWTIHPIFVSKKDNVIQLVSSSPGDNVFGDVAEMQLTLGEYNSENDTLTKRRELIYDVRQRRIGENCRLIVSKEIDSKFENDSAPVSIKCRERRLLDRIRLNQRLMKQFSMAYIADEKQTIIAVRAEATTINTVLYWEDVTLLDTNGSYERCEQLINGFCIWLSEQNIPDGSTARLEYDNVEIKLFIGNGEASSSYKKPTLTPIPLAQDPIDQGNQVDDPLFTIVCEEGRKVPANLSVYNAQIVKMDTFNLIRTDANQLKHRIAIPLTKVLFLTSQKTFESIKGKERSWACYDDLDTSATIPPGFRVEYEAAPPPSALPPPDLFFTPFRNVVFDAPFDVSNTSNTRTIMIENTSNRTIKLQAVVLPKTVNHIDVSHKSAVLEPMGVINVTVTCNPFCSDPEKDKSHRIAWNYLSAESTPVTKKFFINYNYKTSELKRVEIDRMAAPGVEPAVKTDSEEQL